MMENYDKEFWGQKPCPKYDCRKNACKCGLRFASIPAVLGDDSSTSPVAPKNGNYCNTIVEYESNGHIYIYSSEGIPTLVETEGGNVEEIIKELQDALEQEILDRGAADDTLQKEIDAIKNSPDVVDIVPTYAALQAYDTSKLGDNDIIRVLQDEQYDGQSTYYRWDKQTETWAYVGSIQTAANTIFYADLSETGSTRHIYKNSNMTGTVSVQELLDANEDGQVILRMSSAQTPENFNDAYLQNTYVGVSDYQFLFLDNQNYYEYDASTTTDTSYYYSKSTIQLEMSAGTNITITGNTISATDTTYSNFVGTDGVTGGTAGLVPAPAVADAGKFLKADGTWDTAGGGGGVTPVQTTGTSTTDVMSQDATTHMVYSSKNPSTWNGGGVVYMGNLDANQAQQPDPTATAHSNWKYFWALPVNNARVPQNGSINILGDNDTGDGNNSIILGADAHAFGPSTIAIGYNAKGDYRCIAIGLSSCAGNWDNIDGAVAIGLNSFAKGGNYALHIGGNSGNGYGVRGSASANSVAIGKNASITDLTNSVALGAYSKATRQGEVNVGLVNGETTGGYNSTAYRVIGGVHDGQDIHDAATVAQGNILSTSAPDSSTVGVLGQLWTDTTNMHTYQCTAISGSTYTWTQRW